MSGVLGKVLSHYRPGAWSHPDEDLASYVVGEILRAWWWWC